MAGLSGVKSGDGLPIARSMDALAPPVVTDAVLQSRPASQRLREIVETALEHTVNGVVVTDATQPHHPIVHVNGGFTRITGYAAHEVLGRNCNFLQGQDREQQGVSTLREAIARRQPATVLLRNYRKDGSAFWNRIEMCPVADPDTGEVTHFFALQTDVTLQVEADAARERRLLALERTLEGSPACMLAVDAGERVSLATLALERLLGLDLGVGLSPVGMTLAHLRDCIAECAGMDAQAAQALRWPQAGETLRWQLTGAHPRTLELDASPMPDAADGRNAGTSPTHGATSITTPERVVMLREVPTDAADHATRSRFLAMAAHELRTPLGSIRGFTELLLMRDYPREQSRQLLQTVLSQAQRLGALLNDLLDLSQMDAMGREAFAVAPLPLAEVLRRAVQVVVVPGSTRSVDAQWPDEALRVQGHAAKLEQVLINLLSNAIKYSPDGGDVHLRTAVDAATGRICVSVQDHGIGLTPEQQARLFTRFYRANPGGPIPGTGLGLTIVKELVERMGGEITVHSQPGVGSTFTLHLLAGDPPPVPLTQRPDEGPSTPAH